MDISQQEHVQPHLYHTLRYLSICPKPFKSLQELNTKLYVTINESNVFVRYKLVVWTKLITVAYYFHIRKSCGCYRVSNQPLSNILSTEDIMYNLRIRLAAESYDENFQGYYVPVLYTCRLGQNIPDGIVVEIPFLRRDTWYDHDVRCGNINSLRHMGLEI